MDDDTAGGEITWPRVLAEIDTMAARLSRRIETLEASSCKGDAGGEENKIVATNTGDGSLAAAAEAAATQNTTTSPKGDTESRLVTLEARISGMESQFDDIAQREDEYLSGRYDCDALAESLKDLFVAVHREADTRQKQIACLDLRLSQRWQHTDVLQRQIVTLESRVEPLLDDGLPMLQWYKKRMEELDVDVKSVRLASERALAEFTERMAELERSVCSISADTPNTTSRFVATPRRTPVGSGSSCSVGHAEAKALTGCLSKAQTTATGRAVESDGGAAVPDSAGEGRDEVGKDDHSGGIASKACNNGSCSSTEAVSFSATSITLSPTSSCTPRTPAVEEPSASVRGGRVRRLVRQFTDGASAATHGGVGAGSRVVNTKPVESLDVTS